MKLKWSYTVLIMMMAMVICSSQSGSSGRFIKYAQPVFDSDTCCWRLLAVNEKYLDASELIKEYLQESENISNKHSLHWHLGQMLAKARQLEEAKHYFKKTYNIFYRWFGGSDGRAWYHYAKGTVAFLDRDQNILIHSLNSWPKNNKTDINYSMLQTLLENWEQPY